MVSQSAAHVSRAAPPAPQQQLPTASATRARRATAARATLPAAAPGPAARPRRCAGVWKPVKLHANSEVEQNLHNWFPCVACRAALQALSTYARQPIVTEWRSSALKLACLFPALVLIGCSSGDENAAPSQAAFDGICLGPKRVFYDDSAYGSACRAHLNAQTECTSVEGCTWSSTACTGDPQKCQTYGSEASCSGKPLCKWYRATRCDSPTNCHEVMLTEDGGCAVVTQLKGLGGYCEGNAYIDVSGICNGSPFESNLCD